MIPGRRELFPLINDHFVRMSDIPLPPRRRGVLHSALLLIFQYFSIFQFSDVDIVAYLALQSYVRNSPLIWFNNRQAALSETHNSNESKICDASIVWGKLKIPPDWTMGRNLRSLGIASPPCKVYRPPGNRPILTSLRIAPVQRVSPAPPASGVYDRSGTKFTIYPLRPATPYCAGLRYIWALCAETREQIQHLRIGSCLACVYRVMDARGKLGEHERSVRVARGVAECNSSFTSALPTSQVHP